MKFDGIISGFILHYTGAMFYSSNKYLSYLFCGSGLICILIYFLSQPNYRIPFKGVTKYVFIIFLLWSIEIILRPFFSPEPFLSNGYSLINSYTWLSLFVPLITILDLKNLSIERIFKFSYLQGLIGVALFIFNYRQITHGEQNSEPEDYQAYIGMINLPFQFLSATSILFLSSAFVGQRQKFIAILCLLLSAYVSLLSARRGNVFVSGTFLVFGSYLFISHSKRRLGTLTAILLTTGITFTLLLFIYYALSNFSFFVSRLNEDTRSGMEDFFFYSFKGQTWDWLLGRGINGAYFCPTATGYISNRGEIETGYLHMILKGGIVYLSLFAFLLGYSAFLGLFRTNNILSKGMALYLIAHILFLVPFGLPAFNFEYLVVWISVSFCQSEQFRSLNDIKLLNFLILNKRLNRI